MDNSPYVVVLNDTGVIPHHGCRVVMKTLIEKIASWGYQVKTVSVYSDWRIFEAVIDGASAVIVNGEGTIHHSAPRGRRLVEVGPYCRERGIPAFLINTVWQDNSQAMADEAKSFLLLAARESWSQKHMQRDGLQVELVPDLTIGTEYLSSGTRRSGFVFTDAVGLPVTDAMFAEHRRTPHSRYVTLEPPKRDVPSLSTAPFERLKFRGGPGWKRAVSISVTRFIKRALIIRGLLKSGWRKATHPVESAPIAQFLDILGSAELVVTGRFHVVCLCLVTGTPFLAVASNSHKIEGMLEDAGLSHRLVHPSQLHQAVTSGLPWTEQDKRSAEKFVSFARSAQSSLFARIREAIPPSTPVREAGTSR